MYSTERKIRSLAVAAVAVAALLALPRGAPAAQPCEPATGSAVLRFGMVAGMRHRYPDQLVPEFWRFFRSHPLSAAERGRA